MPTYVSSTYMSLPVPIVGTTPGPDYASDINSCLTLIDQHDHSSGFGVQITPSGLNINADLTMANNDLISVRSIRFQTQASPIAAASDLGCLYESGVDLYYNDGSGNAVRITQSGGVAGSPGTIASLASPASATFVAGTGTFVWQSDANVPALMDAASVIIRNPTASANGVTIAAANSLAANYTLTLPAALPAATNFMAVSSTGNISAFCTTSLGITAAMIANATITTTQISGSAAITGGQIATSTITNTNIGSGVIDGSKITSGTLGTSQLTDASVTVGKLAALTSAVSTDSGTFTCTTTGNFDIWGTNMPQITISASRPVMIMMVPSNGGASSINMTAGAGEVRIFRDSTQIGAVTIQNGANQLPVLIYDAPSNGTYRYGVSANTFGTGTININYWKLVAYLL
jgi:hypothetical protein